MTAKTLPSIVLVLIIGSGEGGAEGRYCLILAVNVVLKAFQRRFSGTAQLIVCIDLASYIRGKRIKITPGLIECANAETIGIQ